MTRRCTRRCGSGFPATWKTLPAARFAPEEAEKKVRAQFGQDALERLPRDNMTPLLALGGLLGYLYETQKTDLGHLDQLDVVPHRPVHGAGSRPPAAIWS